MLFNRVMHQKTINFARGNVMKNRIADIWMVTFSPQPLWRSDLLLTLFLVWFCMYQGSAGKSILDGLGQTFFQLLWPYCIIPVGLLKLLV